MEVLAAQLWFVLDIYFSQVHTSPLLVLGIKNYKKPLEIV
jgi:hypothetical protein